MLQILRRMRMAAIWACLLAAVIPSCALAAPLGAVIVLSGGDVQAAAQPDAFDVTVTFDAFDVRFTWGDVGGGAYDWIDLTGAPYSAVTIKNNAAGQAVLVGVYCDASHLPMGIERAGLSMTSTDVQYRDALAPFTLPPQSSETLFVHYDYRAPSGHEGGGGSVQLTITLTDITPEEPEA